MLPAASPDLAAQFEEMLCHIRRRGFTVLATGVGTDHIFFDALSEGSTTDGKRMHRGLVSIARWREELDVAERFVSRSVG